MMLLNVNISQIEILLPIFSPVSSLSTPEWLKNNNEYTGWEMNVTIILLLINAEANLLLFRQLQLRVKSKGFVIMLD